MTKLQRQHNQFKWVYTNRLLIGIYGIFIAWVISRFHIDLLWFNQFDLHYVIIRRWLYQFSGLAVASLIALICLKWQSRWTSLKSNNLARGEKLEISGSRYTIGVLLSLSVFLLTLSFLSIYTWRSIVDPFSLFFWWDNLLTTNLFYVLPSIFLLIILILLQSRKLTPLILQLIGSLLFIIIFARSWGLWALGLAIPPSGIKEPLLNSDISFALGQFSAISYAPLILITFLLLTVANSYWIHLTRAERLSDWSAPVLSKQQKNNLRPICSCISFLGATLLWLSRHQLLWSNGGTAPGAGWLDVHFNLPLRTIASLLLAIFGLIILIPHTSTRKSQLRNYSFLISILSLIIEFVLSPLLQWIIVKPRELSLESKYISRAIKSTRRAFQLDSIQTRLINPLPELNKKDLQLGESTLKNIRLWDSQPLLATNRQLQQFRVYYRFSNAAVDRYRLSPNSAERQQVIITARELDQDSIPDISRTWINRHFVFTHGYGFTISPVNTRAIDGLPDYFISDLGSSTLIEGSKSLGILKENVANAIPIGKAAIYYGIYPSPYAVAPTKLEELDYPEGDQNIFNHYEGSGGIPLSNIFQRISASIYLNEPRLLNTGVLTKDSKLLIRRDIKKRISVLAPFLDVIGDPYLVSTKLSPKSKHYAIDQNQFWIVECYTNSKTYPYSASLPNGDRKRYIRNSVKAIVDAYSGNVRLYITEPDDPIIKGWRNLFPELFADLSDMPQSLKDHLKVPTDLFEMKVQQLLRYHVTDPRSFYSGDDVWQIPQELYGREQIPVEPYHITAQLRPNENSEFLLLQPLSPLARPNLAAWLAARSDGDNYGELILLRFPSQTTIFGPEQIQALINQDPNISQQFSLWDRAGSEVIQGNLLVIPLGRSLLYVEPVYLKASQGGLPTLTRVVVSDGKRIAMEEDLQKGLKALLNRSNDDKINR